MEVYLSQTVTLLQDKTVLYLKHNQTQQFVIYFTTT